jgi:general secretion pathway protein C
MMSTMGPPAFNSLLNLPKAAPRLYQRYGAGLPGFAALVLAIVIARLAARLVWVLVPLPESAAWHPAPAQPTQQAGGRQVDLNLISGAALFGIWQPPALDLAGKDLSDAPDTNLSLTLLGILANGGNPKTSRALIAAQGGEEKPYAIGDDVARGVNLQAIFPDRVILSRGGRLETLRLDKDRVTGLSGPNTPQGEDNNSQSGDDSGAAGTRSLAQVRQTLLADPSKAADYIRVQPVPAATGGGLGGYRIYPGRDRSIFTAAGLKPGDVVTAVNGVQLNDPSRSLQLLSDLSQSTQINLSVDRGGQSQNFSISLSP